MDPPSEEPDLRRQGVMIVAMSAVGTCTAALLWVIYGTVTGLLAFAAVFVILVAVVITGAANASRHPPPGRLNENNPK